MKGLSAEEVQRLIDLTPEQEKAFNALNHAVKRCEKENIYFYQTLDDLGALNGNNVKTIRCDDDSGLIGVPEHIFERGGAWDLNYVLKYPYVKTTDAFADDTHYVQLKTD